MEYPTAAWVGKTLAEIALERNVSDVEAAIVLAQEGFNRRGGALLRGFSLSEIDVELFAAQPWVATASDAGIALPEDGLVHARYYGTFPRKIAHYARNRGVLSIESAIRSMTSLPAQILGIKDRGLIREGMWADLVIMDLDRVRDTSTFFEPHQYPEGIEHVLVGGQFVVENGKLTWALPGRLLTPSNGISPTPAN
jgi:N-acyl-D-aspartate/D-glutamate deacylase